LQHQGGRRMPDAKIAVITGAGSGIGRASAHALLEAGWNVVLAGRRKHMLEETASIANAPSPRTLAVPTDVSDPASIAALFAAVRQTYGRIDLLVNTAAISTRRLDTTCGQIDIGNAATERNTDTSVGRLQASGQTVAEARIDVKHVAAGVAYMASLPPDANVLFMTVMANKMPYVGRG